MAVKLSPIFNEVQLDDNGLPASGWLLETFAANSTTPQATYRDSAGNTPHTNPIVYNSRGEPPFPIYLTAGLVYRMVFTDPLGVIVRTIDDVTGVGDNSLSLSQWNAFGSLPTYVNPNSFSVPGDKTSDLEIGRRLQLPTSGGTRYGTVVSSTYDGVSLTTVVLILDGGTLDNGLTGNAFQIAVLSASNQSVPQINPTLMPGGRLTLSPGVPVTTTNIAAAATVYYEPYGSNYVPVPTANGWIMVPFTQLSQAVADATKSPGAMVANQNYDCFIWLDGAVLRCTRGPTWAAGAVAGSATARGTGVGSSELTRMNGRLVNAYAITNGPAAQRGLYVGSVFANGAATVDDGLTAVGGCWNYYNRVDRVGLSTFTANRSTASPNFTELNSEIRVPFFVGIAEDPIKAVISGNVTGGTTNDTVITAVGFDGTTAEDGASVGYSQIAYYPINATASKPGLLGRHYATLVGKDSGGVMATWGGIGGQGNSRCALALSMKG